VLLGLIGGNIAASQAPRLHELAGGLCGVDVQYDLLVPKDMSLDFDGVFQHCLDQSYRGINVTYPYKELAFAKVQIDDPLVRALGAVNTVLFEANGPKGHNTDYSGFVAAYRASRGDALPGTVCQIGAGGVGKAIAFGLLALGLTELRLVERDLPKAEALADALKVAKPGLKVSVTNDPAIGAKDAEGLVNCSPVGMVGYGGTPLPAAHMTGASWAFDAVYTPIDTPFLGDAAKAGLQIISGYELFYHQGLDAWQLFSGMSVEPMALRQALQSD
jgi:shikimate dehydrogenase